MKNDINFLMKCLLLLRWVTPIFLVTGMFEIAGDDFGALGGQPWFVLAPVFVLRMACFFSGCAVISTGMVIGLVGPGVLQELIKKNRLEPTEHHK